MLATIRFDRQLQFGAIEVNDIRSNAILAEKLQAIGSA